MILGSQPAIIWFWFTWQIFPNKNLLFYLYFPVFFFIGIVILTAASTVVARIFLFVTNLIHHPREGVFKRNREDKDYCYWSLRAVIRKWPIWLSRQISLPYLEKIVIRTLGAKIHFSSSVHEAWVDSEFVHIGKHAKVGQGTLIMSSMIVQNKLILKKVTIKNSVIIGSHCAISPGTVIESGTILNSNTMTVVNQHLEKNSLYRNGPAVSYGTIFDINDKKKMRSKIIIPKTDEIDENTFLRAHSKELSVPFLLYIVSGVVIVGFSFIVPGLLFYPFLFEFIVPYFFEHVIKLSFFFDWKTYLYLSLIPLGLIALYLLHVFFVALFTRFFYRIADKKGPKQGIFDRNMDVSSSKLDYYHFGSFLMKYPIYVVSRSPFPWLLNWELNFIKSNSIGKGTVLEETFIHSHVKFGNNSYLGTTSHITNHLVDGVYGEENLTFVGVDVGENCVFNTHTGVLPGSEIGSNTTFLPGATTIKYDKIIGNGIFGGFPVKKLKKKEILFLLGGEDID